MCSSDLTIFRLRAPLHSLLAYKCVQIFNDEINALSKVMLPPILFLALCVAVTFNVMLIAFYRELQIGLGTIGVIVLVLSVFQSTLYSKVGQLDKHSQNWLLAWGRNTALPEPARLRMIKYVKSCYRIHCKIGDYANVCPKTSMVITHKILFYTGKALLMARKLFQE